MLSFFQYPPSQCALRQHLPNRVLLLSTLLLFFSITYDFAAADSQPPAISAIDAARVFATGRNCALNGSLTLPCRDFSTVMLDGGEVSGLRWYPASGSCGPGDSYHDVNFTFVPPVNLYLQPPPKNQVTFCLSLRLSSQASSSAPIATRCARIIILRCSICLEAGGSLDSTAVQLGVSWVQLWLLNPELSDAPHRIGTQQPLRMGLVHTFGSEDTLHSVAAMYGVSVELLLRWNSHLLLLADYSRSPTRLPTGTFPTLRRPDGTSFLPLVPVGHGLCVVPVAQNCSSLNSAA